MNILCPGLPVVRFSILLWLAVIWTLRRSTHTQRSTSVAVLVLRKTDFAPAGHKVQGLGQSSTGRINQLARSGRSDRAGERVINGSAQ